MLLKLPFMKSSDWGKEMGELQVLSTSKKKAQKDNLMRVLVESSPSIDAWFNKLVGENFNVLGVGNYNKSVKICINEELKMYGWLPLKYCKTI